MKILKKNLKYSTLIMLVLLLKAPSIDAAKIKTAFGSFNDPMQSGVSFQVFYDELAPYGHWVNHERYGYAWAPSEIEGFNPYVSGGHWVYSEYGWTWVSGYGWGWAPFHYGRWTYDPFYGWLWVPGYEWAPAWVCWGSYGGYYGWAPLEPGISNERYYGGYRPGRHYWTFCEREHFCDEDVYRYGRRNTDVTNIYYNHLTVINNYNERGEGGRRYLEGPRRTEVEIATHSHIQPARFANSERAGQDHAVAGQITMYRPAINVSSSRAAAPRRIEPIKTLSGNPSRINKEPIENASPARNNVQQNNPAGQTTEHNRAAIPQNAPSLKAPSNHLNEPTNRPANIQNNKSVQPNPNMRSGNNNMPAHQPNYNNAPSLDPRANPVRPSSNPASHPNNAPIRNSPAPAARPNQQAPARHNEAAPQKEQHNMERPR